MMSESDMAKKFMRVNVAHKLLVGCYLQQIIAELVNRAIEHDDSKFGEDEFDPYARQLPVFEQVEYGSEEYRACVKAIQPAITHHVTTNRHHPEYFGEAGINDMNLIDVIEMVCDWVAASQRGGGSDLRLDLQRERFGIDEQLYGLIERTVAVLEEK